MAKRRPLVIGWKEYIDLPDWQLSQVKVKIDTGARTSALGVLNYETFSTPEGLFARMTLAPFRRKPAQQVEVTTPILRFVRVKNTGGRYQSRPLIATTIRLGAVEKEITLTVADRTRMLFPIILGRTTLSGSFIVDVARKYVLSTP